MHSELLFVQTEQGMPPSHWRDGGSQSRKKHREPLRARVLPGRSKQRAHLIAERADSSPSNVSACNQLRSRG